MADLLIESHPDGLVQIRLNRPDKGNSLTASIVEDLHDAFDSATASPSTRAIIFSGEGRHFSTGFDLGNLESSSDEILLHRFIRIELLLQKVRSAPVLTVCYAHGRTVGAGADLVVACERRIADCRTTMAFPGSGFGIVLGTGRLASRVGAGRAQDFVRTGRQIASEEAFSSGLVTNITSDGLTNGLLEELSKSTGRLDFDTSIAIAALLMADNDRDLAALVRSGARPGLGTRISAYRLAAIQNRLREN